MEQKEILDKIKSTEAKIRKKVDDAHKKGNEIIFKALEKSKNLDEENDLALVDENKKLLEENKKETEKERKLAIKNAYIETENLKKKAKVSETKKFFISKFQEYTDV